MNAETRVAIGRLLTACHVLTFDAPQDRPANAEEVAIEKLVRGFEQLLPLFAEHGLGPKVDALLLAPFQAMLTASADICRDIHAAEEEVRKLLSASLDEVLE